MNIKHLLFPLALLSTYAQAETNKFTTVQTKTTEFLATVWIVKLGSEQSAESKNEDLAKYLRIHNDTTTKRCIGGLISLGETNTETLIQNLEALCADSKLISQPNFEFSAEEPAHLMIGSGDKSTEFKLTATRNETGGIHLELDGSFKSELETTELKGSANMLSNETVILDNIRFDGQDYVLFIRVQDAN